MSAYAKEVAAKQAIMDLDPSSPRKRFRPEDVERLLQSPTRLDDSMNIGDDTLSKSPALPHEYYLLTDTQCIWIPRTCAPFAMSLFRITHLQICSRC
jgi:hypothetical protein